jgi:hypothetical protein
VELRQILCEEDGVGYAAFICRHLFDARRAAGDGRVGFCSQIPTLEDPWPDAWCLACDEHLEATGGEWTDENAKEIALVCNQCYERIRADNDIDNDEWPIFEVPPPVSHQHSVGRRSGEAER